MNNNKVMFSGSWDSLGEGRKRGYVFDLEQQLVAANETIDTLTGHIEHVEGHLAVATDKVAKVQAVVEAARLVDKAHGHDPMIDGDCVCGQCVSIRALRAALAALDAPAEPVERGTPFGDETAFNPDKAVPE